MGHVTLTTPSSGIFCQPEATTSHVQQVYKISRTPTCDKQTQTQTHDDGKYHASIASRG